MAGECLAKSKRSQGGGVIRFVGDFADQFAVDYLVVFVKDDDSAGGQADQRAAGDGDAVSLNEFTAAHGGQVDDILQTFGAAETRLGERQVSRNAENDGVGLVVGLLVELANRLGAGRRVDAREDVEDLALAGQAGQGDVGEVLADQREGRGLFALGRGGFVSIIINLIILLMINTAAAKTWFSQNI